MGGLGPGYEQAIQRLAFEIIREFADEPDLDSRLAMDAEEVLWKTDFAPRRDAIVHQCDSEPWGGFSGAQAGAASNLAFCVLRRGYRKALRELPSNRLIQVCKRSV